MVGFEAGGGVLAWFAADGLTHALAGPSRVCLSDCRWPSAAIRRIPGRIISGQRWKLAVAWGRQANGRLDGCWLGQSGGKRATSARQQGSRWERPVSTLEHGHAASIGYLVSTGDRAVKFVWVRPSQWLRHLTWNEPGAGRITSRSRAWKAEASGSHGNGRLSWTRWQPSSADIEFTCTSVRLAV